MKNAARKWWNYLIAVAGVSLIVGLGIGLHFIIGDPNWPINYSWYFMIFGGVFTCLAGFIAQDLYRGWSRHKLNDWDNPLPEKIINKAWQIFFPILFSGLFSFIIGLFCNFFIK